MTSARSPVPLAYRVKRLYLLASQFIDDALKPHGLGRSQWQVLNRVRRASSVTQREIQAILQVEPATLSCIIDTLVGKEWLERLENPEDKRGRMLRLTPKGAALIAKIPDPVAAAQGRMLAGVSEEERVVVERVLGRMIENLERGRE